MSEANVDLLVRRNAELAVHVVEIHAKIRQLAKDLKAQAIERSAQSERAMDDAAAYDSAYKAGLSAGLAFCAAELEKFIEETE